MSGGFITVFCSRSLSRLFLCFLLGFSLSLLGLFLGCLLLVFLGLLLQPRFALLGRKLLRLNAEL